MYIDALKYLLNDFSVLLGQVYQNTFLTFETLSKIMVSALNHTISQTKDNFNCFNSSFFMAVYSNKFNNISIRLHFISMLFCI